MTPEQAEAEIVQCVKKMDRLRAERAAQPDLDAVEAEISELKKITGPRSLEGEIAFVIPVAGSVSS